jgi:hypothetical protein
MVMKIQVPLCLPGLVVAAALALVTPFISVFKPFYPCEVRLIGLADLNARARQSAVLVT